MMNDDVIDRCLVLLQNLMALLRLSMTLQAAELASANNPAETPQLSTPLPCPGTTNTQSTLIINPDSTQPPLYHTQTQLFNCLAQTLGLSWSLIKPSTNIKPSI